MFRNRNRAIAENTAHSHSHPVSTGWTRRVLRLSKPFQRFPSRRALRLGIPRRGKPLKRLSEAFTPALATRLKPCVNERTTLLLLITLLLLLVGCQTSRIEPVT